VAQHCTATHIHCHTYLKGRGPVRKPIITLWSVKPYTMWNSLYFALLVCLTTFEKANGQKDIKFLVLVEDNAQMDLKTGLGNGLAGAQNANGGFTFAMKAMEVV
jgi:hypothetical protein